MHVRALTTLALLAALSCSHDLDALRSERGSGPGLREDAGSSGSGGRSGSGGSGGSGTGGTDAGMNDAGPGVMGPGPCEPCEELSTAAMMLDLESCCRGIGNTQCGISFPQSDFCLPRFVQGTLDDACPDFNQGNLQLDGCCRPDARCGLDAQALGLGCAAREELLPEVDQGGGDVGIPCQYACAVDDDCNAVPGGFVCAEAMTNSERYCAHECMYDGNCSGQLVCGLRNDRGMDRVLAICMPPLGGAMPGESCTRPQDCARGVCLGQTGSVGVCSELCRTELDCPSDRRACRDTTILTLDSSTPQTFKVCRN